MQVGINLDATKFSSQDHVLNKGIEKEFLTKFIDPAALMNLSSLSEKQMNGTPFFPSFAQDALESL